MKNKVDLNYFPGWTRKSMTFTIDDGNVPLDLKFMSITKPAGFKGTFNLRTPLREGCSDGDYRRIYAGYEIANHCRYHAYPVTEKTKREIKNELFRPETADPQFGYLTGEKGIYRIHTYSWTYLAEDEQYLWCVESCREELERVFGKGKVRGFVWPCGEQQNERVFSALRGMGFQYIRKTGNVMGSTRYALPADRMRWSYNANYTCMTACGAEYDALPDDGELKFFCFGVHSHDFENNGKWDVLEDFGRKYGNRPADFWYASVGEIFDYEDAVHQVKIEDGRIINPSAVTLYIKVDGERKTLWPRSEIQMAR